MTYEALAALAEAAGFTAWAPLDPDTIELKHKNIPYASDIECVAMMFYEVESYRYTTNALDSVKLVNPKVTNEETINFNIYYRASNAD